MQTKRQLRYITVALSGLAGWTGSSLGGFIDLAHVSGIWEYPNPEITAMRLDGITLEVKEPFADIQAKWVDYLLSLEDWR